MNKILITGANGFIGRNLFTSLYYDKKKYTYMKYTKANNFVDLENMIINSTKIIHLAGQNRSDEKNDFIENNINLTKKICKILKQYKLKTPIFFSSSIHAESDTIYGKSKYDCENQLAKLSRLNGNDIMIFRIPGVFGKWSKPNYNSVVSTFCYNTAHGIECNLINPENEISLIYIDDLVAIFKKYLKKYPSGLNFIEIKKIYKIKIKKLLKKIQKFRLSRNECISINLSNGFDKKLYSTYLTYLPSENFYYKLKQQEDERGKFVEVLKTNNSQISVFTAKPFQIRGGHFHNSKVEKFLVLSGKAKFIFRNIVSKKTSEFIISENDFKIIETIPGVWHQVQNLLNQELKILVWANEGFNKKKPDTFIE